MTAPLYEVIPVGNMGNRMFQYMSALSIAAMVPSLKIRGYSLPEWGLETPLSGDRFHEIRLAGSNVPVRKLARLYNEHRVRAVASSALGLRMSCLLPANAYRQTFSSSQSSIRGFDSEHLVINIRGAEILHGVHPDYIPLPIPLIARVIEETNLRPVFVGQLGQDKYTDSLHRVFSDALFVSSSGPIRDFETVRRSKHILISVSTFSWLAAWLSNASTVHMPVLGLYDPVQRPDIDLLPIGDHRYRFYGRFKELRISSRRGGVRGAEDSDIRQLSAWHARSRRAIAGPLRLTPTVRRRNLWTRQVRI